MVMVGGRVIHSVGVSGIADPVARGIETRMVDTGEARRAGESWEVLIASWRGYLKVAGRPDTTIGLRCYHLGRFARQFPAGPASVGFESMVAWLGEQEWSPNTRRSYRASLRVFWEWMVATGRTAVSPAHQLPSVAVPRARPRPIPEKDLAKALREADDRVRLAIMLGAFCGLRRGEIAQARTDDLVEDLVGYSLRVKGKGGHVRLVPMPEPVLVAIRRCEPGWLFPSAARPGHHLTPGHLGKIVTAVLPGAFTTHSLRHRCGTVSYAGSKDVFAVQELLGHAKTETTKLYCDIAADAVRAAMMHAAVA